MKTIPYGRQWIDEDDCRSVLKVLNSDWLTQGPVLEQFEKELCRYTGAKYAVGVASGSTALHLSMLALGIGRKDKVLAPPVTFAASVNGVRHTGADVDFVDINDRTYHFDVEKFCDYLKSPARRKRVKAVIPVHLMGTVVDMKTLRKVCDPYGIKIVEDAAHAMGASYADGNRDLRIGSCRHSDMVALSFHPIKNMTSGEGGAVMTNDKKLYETLIRLRHHGIDRRPSKVPSEYMKRFHKNLWFYDIPEPGYNFHLSEIHCALGLSQLKKIDGFVLRRRQMVDRYNEAFSSIKEIRLPYERPGSKAAYHLYIIRVPASQRQDCLLYLRNKGILTQINYIPLHLFSMYKKLGFKPGDFPVSEKYFEECLSLPLYPLLSDEGHQRIIDVVRKFFSS